MFLMFYKNSILLSLNCIYVAEHTLGRKFVDHLFLLFCEKHARGRKFWNEFHLILNSRLFFRL